MQQHAGPSLHQHLPSSWNVLSFTDGTGAYVKCWNTQCAVTKRARSWFRLPMSCAPTGRPLGPVNTGTVIAGTYIVVQITQGDALPVCQPSGASPVTAAVSSTSYGAHVSANVPRHASAKSRAAP